MHNLKRRSTFACPPALAHAAPRSVSIMMSSIRHASDRFDTLTSGVARQSSSVIVWIAARHSGQVGASGRTRELMSAIIHCRQKPSWRHGRSWMSGARSMQTTHKSSSSTEPKPVAPPQTCTEHIYPSILLVEGNKL